MNVTNDKTLDIAIGISRKTKTWKNKPIRWSELLERLASTTRTPETVAEYKGMSRDKQSANKDVGGFVGGYCNDGRRSDIRFRSILCLDADFADAELWPDWELMYGNAAAVYSTHKHTPDKPRLRLVVPLARNVDPDEYQAIGRRVADTLGIDKFDDSSYQPQRMMYWPSTSQDGEFIFKYVDGTFLDPDTVLATYHNWRDVSSWPMSSRVAEVVKKTADKQKDPLTKSGLVGAFCRAYTIQEAIAAFVPTYQPCDEPNRYTYTEGSTAAGVVIYDDRFSYSHHATDPASGQLVNAWDLVRLHRFRDLDDKCDPDTTASKLPSYQTMADFALKDEKVKAVFAEERKAQAVEDFSSDVDWQKALELDKSGKVKNTLQNLTLILMNDPLLKPLVFNQLLDGIEIKGEVPWKHPSKFWRDADDAQLISYVDSHYGAFSARNYDIAVAKVTDDRSYHPIREFIEKLPEWDGVKRVDTLLIDYLGADDNEYVRAVTRKTLCAAIKRVLQPGCKFDSMLVLNGPQGVGKSTLIAKLAGEWFSDSLNLGDTKDKTAAEKLQGYWILEIGELAGLKKAEVETLRSFLSRQNDIYRAAFGKRATPHLRQCVFFGTTNAESGYLRDTTGNRRFWPVKTPGTGAKHAWDITAEEISQIWAETLAYVKQGEALYLSAELDALAKAEQREAMESDEREGLVQLYLDTLLPTDWDSMDLFERRDFLSGSNFNGEPKMGTVRRTQVSRIEIWCECFGKDRANIRWTDGAELAAILVRLGWKRLNGKVRLPIYGIQGIFVPASVAS